MLTNFCCTKSLCLILVLLTCRTDIENAIFAAMNWYLQEIDAKFQIMHVKQGIHIFIFFINKVEGTKGLKLLLLFDVCYLLAGPPTVLTLGNS